MVVAPARFRPPWQPVVTKQQSGQDHDRWRGSARSRGYDSRWDKARLGHLRAHPLCVCCAAHGIVEVATVVDHIEPHKGDMVKFWNSAMWQGLCEWCDKVLKRPVENAWLAGRAPASDLRLDRAVEGWLHPRAK